MKFFKKIKMIKISEMSVPCAMITSGILAGLIIGLSIFFTTLIFFGGDNNRQKLSVKNPALNRAPQANTLSPEQIKQMQEAQKQRAAQQAAQQKTAPTTNTESATTTN